MQNITKDSLDRLDAWVDGNSICVIAKSSFGDPLDLSEDEVKEFISKLGKCLETIQH